MKKSGLLGSISFVMIIMIASRLLALVSSSVYMSYFGADNVELNIYSYAITIPNTIFTCLGTALSTVVIPIYASHIAQNNRLGAKKFADNIITLSVLLTAVLVVAGIALSPVIPYLTDYTSETEYPFAVKSLMIMMPVMFFYGLNFIFQGMLQSEGKFGWPAFVSVPSSLVVILYVFTLADRFGVTGLLVATFIGLAMQALILVPPLYKTGCAGRISGFMESDDTLLITLTGIARFNVISEHDHSGIYRDAAVDFTPFASDFNLRDFKFNKKELFSKLDFYAYSNKIDLTSEMLKQTPDEQILMTLASLLPFESAEKQALLECASMQKFYDTLLLLLDVNSGGRIN